MPRNIAPPLLDHFRQLYQTVCWMGAISLPDGTWQAFTSLDEDLECPLISSTPNAVNPYLGAPWSVWDIPAMTYSSLMGLDLTSQPVNLNLEGNETDVTVLALNKRQLLRGAYNGAQYEIWRANFEDLTMGRDVKTAGELGNVRVGPFEATWALIPWPAKAAQVIARKLGPLCDVGIYPNEAFGLGRCRCDIKGLDGTIHTLGIKREDWTANATVVSATSKHEIRVSWSGTARGGGALSPEFISRLKEGDAEFKSSEDGGENGGVKRSIKSASAVSSNVADLTLHGELYFEPSPGDALWLVAGCDRTENNCLLFENMNNFQGFNLVPGAVDARRRYQV